MPMTDRTRRVRRHLAVALFVCSLLLTGSASRADAVYTYTGQPFTTCNSYTGVYPPPCSQYSITGSFTVLTPLSANLNYAAISPSSYSFTDNNPFLESLNQTTTTSTIFKVWTNASGDITNWRIVLIDDAFTSGNWYYYIGTLSYLGNIDPETGRTSNPDDFSFLYPNTESNPLGYGYILDSPGAWPSATTPEPSTLPLLATGLLSLIAMKGRATII